MSGLPYVKTYVIILNIYSAKLQWKLGENGV